MEIQEKITRARKTFVRERLETAYENAVKAKIDAARIRAEAEREGWGQMLQTASDYRAVNNGCYFDNEAGLRVVRFFERYLCHSKGRWAGQPFELMEWQCDDITMPLFGWKRENGRRRFRFGYIEVPKKNGKSEYCSGVSLYLLTADGEKGAEVYNAASDHNQAGIVFNEAMNMTAGSERLAPLLEVIPSTKRIVFPPMAAVYRALSAEVNTKEGINWSGLIFDELHAQKTRHLWDTLRYGNVARENPFLVAITTAGYDKNSICWEQHDYAESVMSGMIEDDSFFGYIRAAKLEDDWTDPAVWIQANPSYGIIIEHDEFAQACGEAQVSPVKENTFKRYRLNIWTEQSVRWLAMNKWDACDAPVLPDKLRGVPCWGGLDLSSTSDLTALVLVFPLLGIDYVMPFFWVPQETAIEREKQHRVPYRSWAKRGFLEMTPGNVIDYDYIRKRINEIGKEFNIQEIAIDRWNATQITTQLEGDGFTMVPFGQGYASMSSPTKEVEATVLAGKMAHGGHPVLRWCASNVAVKTDPAGNNKPDKEKSSEKIDGIVALIMAKGRASVHQDVKKSIYEERGVLVF